MKIIFLDIDGVLNCESTFIKREEHFDMTGEILSDVDEEKVILLMQIVKQTDAKIVLTSSWRDSWEKQGEKYVPIRDSSKKADEIFKRNGIEIYSITPHIKENRPKEISKWLDNHGGKENIKFISLDDDFFKFQYDMYGIGDCLVHTCFYGPDGGLKREHVNKAVEILNGK